MTLALWLPSDVFLFPSTCRNGSCLFQFLPKLITKALLAAIDTCWQRENQFSPKKYHWVYQPEPRAGSMPSKSWPTPDELGGISVLFFFCFALVFLLGFCQLLFLWVFFCFFFGGFWFCFLLFVLLESRREREKKEHEDREQGREEELWGAAGGGRIKIYCMKKGFSKRKRKCFLFFSF